ncbi:PLP-dependent aminotransferase family protein [Brevibacillus fluminis]|uniref:aminotransferase-like domain-containing protein n=1 Tax=Brevibacillus fluminis TaxID=511487 RepID=UPI001606E536|nr:PLP-dependent aminotransferase family protein [Brevibacillus fluminis]
MNVSYNHFFPTSIKNALSNDPPGAWIPKIPTDCIRLHRGYPASSLVPYDEIKSAVNTLIDNEHDLPLHYLGSAQVGLLKEKIQRRLSERGIVVKDAELLVTSGSSQALDLIARTLLDQTAVVFMEAPTYMEALETFKNYTKQVISVPIDEHGLKVDVLETLLLKRKQEQLPMPRFMYTIPSFHNPSGVTMNPERRHRLLQLASTFDFLIVEDDAYGELSFSEKPIPLKVTDPEQRVLHVGSLSKVVAPGMRIGWIAGAEKLVSACNWFKKDLDHPFAQATIGTYLQHTDLEQHITQLRNAYRSRRDVLVAALEQSMPEYVKWTIPGGGYFVWLHVPNVDTSLLLEKSLSEGVSFIPGKYFFLTPSEGKYYLRLSFSYEEPERMVEGIQKIGELITENYT